MIVQLGVSQIGVSSNGFSPIGVSPNGVSSVTNSSSGLIFGKIQAQSGRLFCKNPGENLGFSDFAFL